MRNNGLSQKNGVDLMSKMPREEGIDHSLSLIREGYMYILNKRRNFGCNSRIFEH